MYSFTEEEIEEKINNAIIRSIPELKDIIEKDKLLTSLTREFTKVTSESLNRLTLKQLKDLIRDKKYNVPKKYMHSKKEVIEGILSVMNKPNEPINEEEIPLDLEILESVFEEEIPPKPKKIMRKSRDEIEPKIVESEDELYKTGSEGEEINIEEEIIINEEDDFIKEVTDEMEKLIEEDKPITKEEYQKFMNVYLSKNIELSNFPLLSKETGMNTDRISDIVMSLNLLKKKYPNVEVDLKNDLIKEVSKRTTEKTIKRRFRK